MGETRLRIYVGGLGPNVKEEDLKKTFGSLGTVESVELNRNKGRSFGYMEFVPSSDKSLVKLFSAYNGCMWKGGKLKLEKAREHYLSRLKREWNEEAELAAAKLAKQNHVKEAQVVRAPTKFGADQDIQIKVYFPKLRKIRPLPFKGTGKHKYSFQRVEVPPLPINFCDCEEHSALASGYTKSFSRLVSAPFSGNTEELFQPPVVAAKGKYTNDIEPEAFMVTEQEVDIMKSVLNKLVEKENSSSKISNESKFTKKINHPAPSGDNLQDDDSEEGQVSDHDNDIEDDDDDVVINVVGRSSNRVDPFEDWQPKTSVNQDSLSAEMVSVTGSQKMELQDKMRKPINHPVTSGDNLQVGESEEDQVSDDDDDVVINVVGRSSNRVDPFEDWRPKATVNLDSLSAEMESVTGSQKMKLQHDKKRKAPASETENDNRSSKRMTNNENLSSNSGPKATDLSLEVAPVRKNAWKNLVAEKGSTSFHISDILTSLNAEGSKLKYVAPCSNKKETEDGRTPIKELEILSDDQSKESTESESDSMESAEIENQPMESSESESEAEESAESESEEEEAAESESQADEAAESESQAEEAAESESQAEEAAENESQSKEAGETECQSKEAVECEIQLAENDRHDDQTNENKELEMPSAVNKPDKLNESDNKSARGTAWLHKKSWTQLVADASSKSFSFSEILPAGTSEKQELPKCESNVFPTSKDESFLAGYTSKHSGGVEVPLVEKQDNAGLNKDKTTSDGDKKVERNTRVFERRDVVVSETCPFMRSAASRKEWAKTKAALSRSLKKKTKVKEMDSD